MDGMYAGFAGAKTGHRNMTFCGCAVICRTSFLALVALAAFYLCFQGMQPEIFETNIGEPVLRRALSIRYRSQAHPLTRNQSRKHRMFGHKYS